MEIDPKTHTRTWALRAAYHDSYNLITPRARLRALLALHGDTTGPADAARVILNDGGAQQGGTNPWSLPYISARFDVWRNAADLLERWMEE